MAPSTEVNEGFTMTNTKSKLKLTVQNVETFETRAAPTTVCPDDPNMNKCLRPGYDVQASKVTAVAFF